MYLTKQTNGRVIQMKVIKKMWSKPEMAALRRESEEEILLSCKAAGIVGPITYYSDCLSGKLQYACDSIVLS
jgi:hypothetical protein